MRGGGEDVPRPRGLSEAVPLSPAAREEFVFAKLRREEQEEGLYIIRWSVLDFNRMILSVVKRGHQQVRCDSQCSFPGNGELREVFDSLGTNRAAPGLSCATGSCDACPDAVFPRLPGRSREPSSTGSSGSK